jgi:hypothetical protein
VTLIAANFEIKEFTFVPGLGQGFKVKDKDGIKDPKSSLKMLILPNNWQFGPKNLN